MTQGREIHAEGITEMFRSIIYLVILDHEIKKRGGDNGNEVWKVGKGLVIKNFTNCGKELRLPVNDRKAQRALNNAMSILDHFMEDGPERMEVRSVKRPVKNSRWTVMRSHIKGVRVTISSMGTNMSNI